MGPGLRRDDGVVCRKEAIMARTTRAQKRAFLEALGETGVVSEACRRSCLSDKTAYALRARDRRFAADWRLALLRNRDQMKQEAIRRAVTGWTVPVFYQGKPCGEAPRYSDRLLVTLLGLPLEEPPWAPAERQSGDSEEDRRSELWRMLDSIDGTSRGIEGFGPRPGDLEDGNRSDP
jgi:hypothetical protein